jgi:hypothetical protein
MEVYEKILSGNPSMPTFFTRNLSDLIKKLLRSQQGKRLGNTRGGTAAVVKHKWFSSFDWASIENGEAKAPYMPNIKGKDDVTNFDQFDEGDVPVRTYSVACSCLSSFLLHWKRCYLSYVARREMCVCVFFPSLTRWFFSDSVGDERLEP